jgi:predicted nuclease of predicted toxin-antitoxin system
VKLLLDEMLSPAIAQELRARGHDVQAVAEHADRAALSDHEVMTLARDERRAIVTNNVRDFRPLHVDAVTPGGPGHFGMIFMAGNYRRTRNDIGRIVAALEEKLIRYAGDTDLANAEDWL